MGVAKLDQRGVSIFEISIIILILIFVGFSCWMMVHKVKDSTRTHYENTGIHTGE
jgi:TRAP-type C4-dicarboxylate transport system permease small subunit